MDTLLATRPADGWTQRRAGMEPKGHGGMPGAGCPWRRRWLVVRGRLSDPTDLPASVVFAPQETTVANVVRVAGTRWTMERRVEAAMEEVGLDEDKVRRWTGWSRHRPLAP